MRRTRKHGSASSGSMKQLLRLWQNVFVSAPAACGIYLGLYILLSLLRPTLAIIWGRYADLVAQQSIGQQIVIALVFLAAYWLINFACELLDRYLVPREEIERLDVVQKNRIEELFVSRIYEKIARMKPELFETPSVNDMIGHMYSFFSAPWQGLSWKVMMQSYVVVAKLVSVISIAVTLGVFNPYLSILVVASLIPTLYARLVATNLRFKFVQEHEELMRKADYFQKLMLGDAVREMKVYNMHGYLFGKWKEAADEYAAAEAKTRRNEALINVSVTLISNMISIGANIFAILLFTQGKIVLGALSGTMALISTLLGDTEALISALSDFLSARNEAGVYSDFVSLEESRGQGETKDIDKFALRNLCYRYPGMEKNAVDGITLNIKKGDTIALVGENGAGKSTLIKLIAGILTPQNGEIEINGMRVQERSSAAFRQCFAAVSQDPSHYTTFTASDNVYMGDTARVRDEEEIAEALRFAGLKKIDSNAVLGKDIGGTDISGGEWQRLAIARSVYRNRDFVLLDEPTASLDPVTENEIFNQYMALAKGKTVIIVTHRVSAAKMANRIIVMDAGKIAEEGTYNQLLENGGLFSRMHHEQSQWYER